jgi:hypothetical protein
MQKFSLIRWVLLNSTEIISNEAKPSAMKIFSLAKWAQITE